MKCTHWVAIGQYPDGTEGGYLVGDQGYATEAEARDKWAAEVAEYNKRYPSTKYNWWNIPIASFRQCAGQLESELDVDDGHIEAIVRCPICGSRYYDVAEHLDTSL